MIIEEARKLLGVPFKHQGRNEKCGVDCVGIAVIIAKKLGLKIEDNTSYGVWPNNYQLINEIKKAGLKKVENPKPGDILIFKIKKYPQHLAIMTDKGILHAHQAVGKVVEHTFTDKWKKRLVGVYRLEI